MDNQLSFEDVAEQSAPSPSGVCSHCGHEVIEYKFNFSKGHAKAMLRILNYKGQHFRTKHIAKHDKSVYTNMQKLAYWGLIRPYVYNEETQAKRGCWIITERGDRFARGEIPIQEVAVRSNKTTVRFEGDFIFIKDPFKDWQIYEEFVQQLWDQ